MPQIRYVQTNYQFVKMKIARGEVTSSNGMDMALQMAPPPGFRLHSFDILKDGALVGQPHQLICVFEQMTERVEDVADDHPALANQPAGPQVTDAPEGSA